MPILTDRAELLPVPTSRDQRSQDKVLFAFCDKDRNQFFPSFQEDFPQSDDRFRLDTSTHKSSGQWEGFLREFRPTVLVSCWSTPPLPAALLRSEDFSLRYLCHTTGTVRNIVSRDFLAGGGIVTNWGNVISRNVAEHALLLILSSLRNITRWRPSMQVSREVWGNGQVLKTRSLQGKKVGLHGFGKIAIELLRLLAPFDVECLAFSQNVPPDYMRENGATPCAELKELFGQCDVIVECEALTPQSANSVTEEHFRLMPDEAVFVNVGRGSVVDENALIEAAREGRIRVALDVYELEPLPADSPLLKIDGLILSPHIAGPAGDWFHRCGDHALNNVNRYLAGEPLKGLVTLEVYDRST